jgi:hypothetical protein
VSEPEKTKSKRHKAKRARFLRVAERRTLKTLRDLRLLAKCSNRASYSYTPDEVDKIFDTVQDALNRAKHGFTKDRELAFSLGGKEVVDEEDVEDEEA